MSGFALFENECSMENSQTAKNDFNMQHQKALLNCTQFTDCEISTFNSYSAQSSTCVKWFGELHANTMHVVLNIFFLISRTTMWFNYFDGQASR